MARNRRQTALTRSIQRALFRNQRAFRKTIIGRILAFFDCIHIKLIRFDEVCSSRLRRDVWGIDDEEYHSSFRSQDGDVPLKAMGDLGYSGSTFLTTSDCKFLVKSLPRHFEHSFFRTDLFEPYCNYMTAHPGSLLVRITDYLYAPYITFGSLVGTISAHHIVMENACYGKTEDCQWETYDLKPIDYFYPERDLLPEQLVSAETMDKLADTFDDKIRITHTEYEDLKQTLNQDTGFLESANAVDYSLFLIRYPASVQPAKTVGAKSAWREGVRSADGKWTYRAVLLDFFWAKHKLHAQAMTGLVQTFNVIGRMGPMSITTTAEEYAHKFLQMVDGMIEIQESTPLGS
ncbi:hypothetical protein ASPZODRAFT_132271 [Penicilliopsis zonata CBS 506.65]|uniref:PIPK domain-containing protein n=1 Tax=Penicilliopsis zonata CBS 506.65 TaxID=1073090 RepID=A0A1L9SJF4_9EURO|nr:hypothetical protein ASPZODRAFT_132271 [Penicilliopsis zonata CBS 506.65]OJJ47285.1 hypothetical protein ASPZODRAFT_132271 [Penicilliopsis zonata CBS 506.65]